MKTIQIPDEMYNKLITMAKDYAEQDNRSTAMPYYLQIQTTKEVVAAEGCGTEMYIDGDGTELRSDEDIVKYFEDYNQDNNCTPTNDIDELKEVLEELHDFIKINVTEENHYQGVFFTENACRRHIESNKHNYREPKDYGSHAFRNPEMKLISDLLMLLGK